MGFASPQEAQSYRSTVAQIESSGNRFNRTDNQYGLYQFSPDQFRHLGITDWTNVDQQNRALTIETNENRQAFLNTIGREPTGADLYMMHQQGAGAINHLRNPDAPAWQNMYATAEGRQKGPGWAQRAISGNIPRDDPLKRVPVDQITSKQFTDMWARKFNRFGGQQAPAQVQQPQAPTVQQPPRQRGDQVRTPVAFAGPRPTPGPGMGWGNPAQEIQPIPTSPNVPPTEEDNPNVQENPRQIPPNYPPDDPRSRWRQPSGTGLASLYGMDWV
jgi:hypothetical protein